MQDLLNVLMDHFQERLPVAWCEIVSTRGSTPQKVGARMLVRQDGTQWGTLGGGCVEADVRRQALQILSTSAPAQVCTFLLDSDYGWDDGLICGGRMSALITPFLPQTAEAGQTARDYFQALVGMLKEGARCMEVVSVADEHSRVPVGSRYLFGSQRNLAATLGPTLSVDLQKQFTLEERTAPLTLEGWAKLSFAARIRLLIIGGGHIGQAVAALASQVDFEIWVMDDREAYVSMDRFPTATRRMTGRFGPMLHDIVGEVNEDVYVLIVTRGHNHDEEALFHLAPSRAGFVGMIGSKRKVRLIFDDLQSKGIPREKLNQVRSPVGLDIGSRTVPEIAVSIVAELIRRRNKGVGP